MGNQLIFWYRRKTVRVESWDTNHPSYGSFLRVGVVVSVGTDRVVGKRVNRGDAEW